MPRSQPMLFVAAGLIAVIATAPRPASANPLQQTATVAETQYAALLRSINPRLKQTQSLSFARSMLANAERSGLDPQLLTALVTVESAWRPNAISSAGARGLGQLMPQTERKLGVNAADPAQNLHGAARYLRAMIDRFAGRGRDAMRYAIGAYNAGPQAVERFGGIPPYGETRSYVRKVMSTWHALGGKIARVAPKTPDEQTCLPGSEASALAVSAGALGGPAQDHAFIPAQPEGAVPAER
jgi:soluble lytic murein transglycosylase-like protein